MKIKIIKGRKGASTILTDNFLELLLAFVVVVGAGVVIGRFIYQGIHQEQDGARAQIESIKSKVELLKEGEEANLLVRGPCRKPDKEGKCDWFLMGWSSTDETRPEKCHFSSCLCICNGKLRSSGEQIVQACQEKGICRTFNKEYLLTTETTPAKYIPPALFSGTKSLNFVDDDNKGYKSKKLTLNSGLNEYSVLKGKTTIQIGETEKQRTK